MGSSSSTLLKKIPNVDELMQETGFSPAHIIRLYERFEALDKERRGHLWREEWIKHGTCAGCDGAMGSPLLYFQAAVKLRKLFDINSVLESSGIKASCEVSYKYDDISKALTSLLGDNFDLQCVTDSKGREAWIQLKIHLSRNQTIGCPTEKQDEAFYNLAWYKSPGHPCPKNTTIFFVPINYDNPHEPCN